MNQVIWNLLSVSMSRLPRPPVSLACGIAILSLPAGGLAQSVPPPEILRQLHGFQEMGSVLYIAAHPDDENTELITYFARAEVIAPLIFRLHVETADRMCSALNSAVR